jgi:hypothetical protein
MGSYARIAAMLPTSVWCGAEPGDLDALVPAVLRALLAAPAFQQEIHVLTDGSLPGCCCDSTVAAAHKTDAMKAFTEGRLKEAAALYTKALQHTDESNSAGRMQAARLYANRALCCLKLSLPLAAEEDASNAIVADGSYTKGYYRRACARIALLRPRAAAQDIKAAQERAATEQEKQQLQALIRQLHELEQTSAGDDGGGSEHAGVGVVGGGGGGGGGVGGAEDSSRECCGLSSFDRLFEERAGVLRVDHGVGIGRHCVVKREVRAGEVLMTDFPVDAVLRKRHRSKRCWRCHQRLPLLTAVPCAHAPTPLFCSRGCREADRLRHPLETAVRGGWTQVLPEEVLLALRCALHCHKHPDGDVGGKILKSTLYRDFI